MIFGPVLGPILLPLLKLLGVKLAEEAKEAATKLAKGKVVTGGLEHATEVDKDGTVVKEVGTRPPL